MAKKINQDIPLSDRVDPELYKQKDEILKLRDEIMRQGRKGKRDFEKEWFRNVLLQVGRHWISWNKSLKKWVDTPDLGKWYPKPVTNKFAESANALKALLTEKKMEPIITPETDSEEDIATAQRGDVWEDVIREEAGSKIADAMAASWMVITGNCFFHQYYSISKDNGTVRFNYFQCKMCAQKSNAMEIQQNNETCPQCNQGKEFEQAVGTDGQPEGFEMPKGKLTDEACSPFEMFFNSNVDRFDKVREIIRAKSVPISEIEDTYPELKDKVSAGGDMPDVYKKALKTVTQSTMGYGGVADGESALEADVHYMFVKPNNTFENGIVATIIGNEIVELSDVENYTDLNGVCFLPFSYSGANYVPGRFWFKTRMDDVASLQFDRNLFQSFIQLQLLTLAAGKWLDPGTNMDTPTGEPAQVIKYDYTVEGRKPELMSGIPPPPLCLQVVEKIDKDIESTAASYDVLKGQLPPGLDTFSGLRLLTERAFSVHGEMVENWENVQIDKLKKQLELARKHFIEPRNKTIEGENGSYETQSFSRADLMGGVNIRVLPGSSIPKSPSVENAAIVESIKLGIVDVQNPKIKYKVLQKLGQQDLAGGDGDDIKDAAAEWRDFLEAVKTNPTTPHLWVTRPRKGIDNEAFHYRDAMARAKTDIFFKLPQQAQNIWIEHALYHKANLDAAMNPPQAPNGAMRPSGLSASAIPAIKSGAPIPVPGVNSPPGMNGNGASA